MRGWRMDRPIEDDFLFSQVRGGRQSNNVAFVGVQLLSVAKVVGDRPKEEDDAAIGETFPLFFACWGGRERWTYF